MKKFLPFLLGLVGLLGGAAAGWFLRPLPDPANAAAPAVPQHYAPAPANTVTMRLPNQFIVPVIEQGRVRSMMVMSLALELVEDHGISLDRHEARLRAVFLQTMFDYANLGGFEGVFTSGEALLTLRRTLREAARQEMGPKVHDVLITELLRQEG